jgi:hypothetical protein
MNGDCTLAGFLDALNDDLGTIPLSPIDEQQPFRLIFALTQIKACIEKKKSNGLSLTARSISLIVSIETTMAT